MDDKNTAPGMTPEEAIKRLNALTDYDSEKAHIEADDILRELLRTLGQEAVADAFDRAERRIGFWYA